MILFEHTSPLPLLVAVLSLIAIGFVFSTRRHLARSLLNALLFCTSFAVILVLAWCLLLPGRKDDLSRVVKPRFAVVLDTSASMSLRPRDDAESRWDQALQLLRRPSLAALEEQCLVDVFPLAEELGDPVPLSGSGTLEPAGSATHLRAGLDALAERYAGLPVAGVLVLSDGLDTREAFTDWAGEQRPFPVFAVRLEDPGLWREEVEVRVDSITTPRRVNAGWKSDFTVLISGQGAGERALAVQLYRDDQLVNEQPTQLPSGGGRREVSFQLDHPEVGVFTYRAYVPPLPEEGNTNDNDYAVSVQVTDARNRLLYLEGVPRWEYKFMRRALLGQREITPVIFYAGPDGTPRAGSDHRGVTPDMTPAQLAYFKIVILGNLDAAEIGEQRVENLVRFVNDGGSLMVLGGSRAWSEAGLIDTALSAVLPVRGRYGELLTAEEAFPLRLTDAARSHPAFAGDADLWSAVPPILSLYAGFTPSPAAQTLVTAETPQGLLPVVVTHRYGQGRVAVVLTDSLWKWQLAPSAGDGSPYARFWTQMLASMLPDEDQDNGPAVQIFTDHDQLYLGDEVTITARVTAETESGAFGVRAVLTGPDGREIDFDMQPRWVSTAAGKSFPGHQLVYTAREAGMYKVIAEVDDEAAVRQSDPLSFYVKPYSPETVPRPADEEVLSALAASGGGEYADSAEAMDRMLGGIRPPSVEETTAEFTTLWRTWPTMLVIMLLLIASWINRKARGMP